LFVGQSCGEFGCGVEGFLVDVGHEQVAVFGVVGGLGDVVDDLCTVAPAPEAAEGDDVVGEGADVDGQWRRAPQGRPDLGGGPIATRNPSRRSVTTCAVMPHNTARRAEAALVSRAWFRGWAGHDCSRCTGQIGLSQITYV
jgi:hypothetical protein